jgi:thiopeptide-type bacteriocin biosynthesis protein
MRWLIDHLSKTPGPATTREVHDQAIHLANPHDEWSALRTTTGGQVLIQAWSARRKALAVYRNRITEAGETEPGCVLACLLHLHHVRMNGIDPDRERVSHRLARAAALRWAAQERREKP